MSPEDQEYFETFIDLFATKGWKQFIKHLEEIHKYAVESTHLLNDTNEFFERRGNIHSYAYLINFEDSTKAQYEQAQSEESEEDEEVV